MARLQAGVYGIQNTITGEWYVGVSINAAKRKRTHFNDLAKDKHCNPRLQASYNEHGAGAFAFSILELMPDGLSISDFEAWRSSREQFHRDRLSATFNSAGISESPSVPLAPNNGRPITLTRHVMQIWVTPEDHAMLKEAARIEGRPITQIVIRGSLELAKEVLQRQADGTLPSDRSSALPLP